MKFYQSKIFKIIMSIIAIIIIFKYSFLIFVTGIGLVVYLNTKNGKFKSFHKAVKIILSSFLILFTVLSIGIKNAPTTDKSTTANSNVETSSEAAKPSDNAEVKEDANSTVTEETKSQETKQNTDVQQTTTKDEKAQPVSAPSASTSSSSSNNNSVNSSDSTSTNSTTNNTTETSTGDENTIVYYVPNSNVYHLSKSDSTLKKSKTIYEITLKEAKAKGMHQSRSKADN